MDERFVKEEGAAVFTGNELIVKGALESRTALITGYPGSPVSDVFEVASANRELLKKHGILAEMANNEALAVARLNGARMAGVRAMAVMKSVGLHVASDGLALGNLSEPNNEGGCLVVVGDDPWMESTQINNDSRFLSQHLHMPVLEPATFQEIKDWIAVGFKLSSRCNLYITYLLTTNQADGGGTVWVHPNAYPDVNVNHPITLDTQRLDLDRTVLLPPRTWAREATLPQRFDTLLQEARRLRINRLAWPTARSENERFPMGLLSSGLASCSLEHALAELGLSGKLPILKLGLTYPVDSEGVLALASRVDALYIVEEKRGFLEGQILGILQDARQSGHLRRVPEVWGKKFPHGLHGVPETRGLNASVISEILIPVFLETLKHEPGIELAKLRTEQALMEATTHVPFQLSVRTPTFCPGCPHRDSSSVFLEIKKDFMDTAYMKKHHHREPVDLVFHGETGCFTMLMFEPNKPLMHNYSGMGLGGGTGAGLDPFITNKQIVFLGDSTFFHSGMLAISDSIKSGQDITYVVLDNKTTAMTGHQPTPGTNLNLMGDSTFAQNIEEILAGMTRETTIPVTRVNPAYRDGYRALLEETVLRDGVKVVIADKECGITYHRRVKAEKKKTLRRQGYFPSETYVNITPEVCEFCLECTRTTGCPGLTVEETLYGPKIVTSLSSCVSDGACAKVKACPSFEEVTVQRQAAPREGTHLPDIGQLPVPALPDFDRTWNIYTAGVGGMGTGLISAILVCAAEKQGFRVLFSDKKGLAIRNGGVYGHVLLLKEGGTYAPLVPYGKADLLLGIDLLEAARGLDPSGNLRVASTDRTRAIVNTALNPTVRMLLGQDEASGQNSERLLRDHVRPDGYWGGDCSRVSERYFGSSLYANLVLLGAAYQKGTLPFSLESLEAAIIQSVPKDERQANRDAFCLGRLLVERPEQVLPEEQQPTLAFLMEEKVRYLRAQEGPQVAADYRFLVEEAVIQLGWDETTHRHLAQRVYDLVCYENLDLARRYVDLVLSTAQKDRAEWDYQATQAVLKNAFKVIAIKDEVYVAHLLTSPEKRARDRARFRIDETNGDRLSYRHINRPEFVIFGKTLRWDMTTHDWQLKIMRRLKFLRRWLPQWHRAEKEFRDWYLDLVRQFDVDREDEYRLWVQILNSPETVRGYREIRRPLMREAQDNVARWRKELQRLCAARSAVSKSHSIVR